jgi:DNA-directed RNA polymerase specialized sigma24 family protein
MKPYFDDDAEPVNVTMPVYPDDEQEQEPEHQERTESEAVRRILRFLDSLPPEPDKAAILVRILLRRTRFDTGSLRESARKAGVPLTTFIRENSKVVHLFSEEESTPLGSPPAPLDG